MTDTQTIHVDTTKQFFLDDLIVDSEDGLSRTLHQPAKYTGNPLMFPLYPWEGRITLYGNVMRDPEDPGLLRMWYTGYGGMGVRQMGSKDTSKWAHLGFDPNNLLYKYCYATSRDGIFWDRPNLGLVEYEGSTDNNIVLLNASSGNVIHDPRDPDPARRYKALFFESREKDGTSNEGDGFSVGFSPDGLCWTKYEGNPVSKRSSDAHTLLGWDERHGQYVAYARPSVHLGNKTRRIGRAVSDDFNSWTDPEDILVPDDDDPPGLEFYGMPVFTYEDLYIGLLYAYHTPPEERQITFFGKIDVQLAHSRNGIQWHRTANRAVFMPNGPPNSIDAGEIYMANTPLVVGDELWFYYSPSAIEHGPTGRSGPICLAKLRLDGFVSVDACEEGGSLVTVPFECTGGDLEINASARGGQVSVAVLDEEGYEQPGFARVYSAVFDGDSVRQRMMWKDVTFDSLKGQRIRLKFYLRNASLYAFRQTG
tara:strand:+ start:713 stop:2149 length:1437 start_codon:yes stop_codon:yes gene_type:complete